MRVRLKQDVGFFGTSAVVIPKDTILELGEGFKVDPGATPSTTLFRIAGDSRWAGMLINITDAFVERLDTGWDNDPTYRAALLATIDLLKEADALDWAISTGTGPIWNASGVIKEAQRYQYLLTHNLHPDVGTFLRTRIDKMLDSMTYVIAECVQTEQWMDTREGAF